MVRQLLQRLIVVTVFSPTLILAAETQALFDLQRPSAGPFPSDRFTVGDPSQNTGRRINLPRPDCRVQVSDCEDIDLLNELDGFNVQPRLSIPFSGPIDVTTVDSKTVLLIPLGSARPDVAADDDDDEADAEVKSYGRPIGINQIVWDVATNTLHAESDELLEQQARYALIVTKGVKDPDGRAVKPSPAFERFRHDLNFGQSRDRALKAYRKALLTSLVYAATAGVHHDDIVAASVFTTMSVSSVLEKIRSQILARAAEPADFFLGPVGADGSRVRTVFPLTSVQSLEVREQVSTVPTFSLLIMTNQMANLRLFPGAVGTVAFGAYRSPVYLNAEVAIPQIATRTGVPISHRDELIYFHLLLPAATADRPVPSGGWPVVVYGSGCCGTGNKYRGGVFNVAAKLAQHGIATIAIDPPGAGWGPLSTFTVRLTSGAVITLPSGGRGVDLNGDGVIGGDEGNEATGRMRILFSRDTRRQAIADMMRLVRVIQAGVDADRDGIVDLDASRIYYLGHSHGATNGVPLVATEPGIRAAAFNAAGGLAADRLRLSVGNRSSLGELLASRTPSLINVQDPSGIAFNENLPLRNQAPVINTVPGAMEIQEVFERLEWLYMPADAVGFAPFLTKAPLAERTGTPVVVQLAKGDTTVPNPATTAIIRAGELADRTTYYRTDIAVCRFGIGPAAPPPNPPPGVETNGHNFLIRMNSPTRTAIALSAQEQAAVLFESDGATMIDPDGACLPDETGKPGCLFEVPIQGPLPEDLGFIVRCEP